MEVSMQIFLVAVVSRMVGWSVGWSVRQLKNTLKGDLTCVTAPAHPYVTDAVVYTALFFFNGPMLYLSIIPVIQINAYFI